MAENATFKVKIYGETTEFENSLKGINSAMSSLKSEASGLKRQLNLDPTNTKLMGQLQENLANQLQQTKNKAAELKTQMSNIDKSTPDGQQKWLKLSKDLNNAQINAQYLEQDIKKTENAIESGNWKIDPEMDTSKIDNSIEKTKSKFSGLKEIAIGAFRKIGETAISAVGSGLKGWVSDAMDTQKAMNALKSTMSFKGNGKEFDYVSKSMKTLAQDTNASSEDTLKLSTTFIGLGNDAKTAVSKTEALTKANQKFGGTGEQLKGVAQAYGQMSAAGKVSAENINQLTDNNTALGSALKSTIMEMNPALAKYGSFSAASEKGAVSVEMMDKAMQKMSTDGGSSIATIGDSWDSFNESVSNDLVLPVLEALTPVLSSIIDKMADLGSGASKYITIIIDTVKRLLGLLQQTGALDNFAKIWDNLKSIFGSVSKFIFDIIKSFLGLDSQTTNSKSTIEQVSDVITALSENMKKITGVIADVVKKFTDSQTSMDIAKGAIVALGGAFAAFKIGTGIITAISTFQKLSKIVKSGTGIMKAFNVVAAMNPYVLIAAAIAAVIAGLVYFFTQTKTGKKMFADFVDFVKKMWEGIVKTFNDVVDGIKSTFSSIGQFFTDLWTGITEGVTNAWNGIVEFFTSVVDGIKEKWNAITEFFGTLWLNIQETFTNGWNAIVEGVTNVVKSIIDFFQPLIDFYKAWFDLVKSIFELGWALIKAGVRAVVAGFMAVWTPVAEFFTNLWNGIKDATLNVWNSIVDFISGVWERIKGVWGVVAGWFTDIWNKVSEVASNVWNNIVSFASSAWDKVKAVWAVVSGWFRDIFNAVAQAVSAVFDKFKGWASNAWTAVTNVFNSVGQWFSDAFGTIGRVVSDAFGKFGQFAQDAWDAITRVFGGIGQWFSDAFSGVSDAIQNALGWVTGTINKISGALDKVAGVVNGMFQNNIVADVQSVGSLSAAQGVAQSAYINDSKTYNSFTITTQANDAVAVAREVKKQFELGRA